MGGEVQVAAGWKLINGDGVSWLESWMVDLFGVEQLPLSSDLEQGGGSWRRE